jgi:hypothetical protein
VRAGFFTKAVKRAEAITGEKCKWLTREYFYPYNFDQRELTGVTYPSAYAIYRWTRG